MSTLSNVVHDRFVEDDTLKADESILNGRFGVLTTLVTGRTFVGARQSKPGGLTDVVETDAMTVNGR
jgi:hypothetical protein